MPLEEAATPRAGWGLTGAALGFTAGADAVGAARGFIGGVSNAAEASSVTPMSRLASASCAAAAPPRALAVRFLVHRAQSQRAVVGRVQRVVEAKGILQSGRRGLEATIGGR